MYYQPTRALGLLVGAVLTSWALVAALLLVNASLSADFGFWAFLASAGAAIAVVLAALFAFWSYALATLAYSLDRNGLAIQWGPTRQVVPLQSIERLVPATSLGLPRVRGVSWWGYHVGTADLDQVGPVLCYSTHQSVDQLLYVMTTDGTYAISVEDPAEFAREIQMRQELGPIVSVTHHVERTGTAAQPIWHDGFALRLSALAGALLLAVWLQVAIRYGDLPPTIAIHFPAVRSDSVVTVSGRDALLEVPRAATVLLGLNLIGGAALLTWDRVAGYIVLGAGSLAQVALFVAVAVALA